MKKTQLTNLEILKTFNILLKEMGKIKEELTQRAKEHASAGLVSAEGRYTYSAIQCGNDMQLLHDIGRGICCYREFLGLEEDSQNNSEGDK